MMENLKKLGIYGVGLALLTQEKIEELVKEASKEGKISKEDSKKAVKELIEASTKEKEKLSKSLKKEIQNILKEVGIPTKKDFVSIENKLGVLEREIAELKKK